MFGRKFIGPCPCFFYVKHGASTEPSHVATAGGQVHRRSHLCPRSYILVVGEGVEDEEYAPSEAWNMHSDLPPGAILEESSSETPNPHLMLIPISMFKAQDPEGLAGLEEVQVTRGECRIRLCARV
jgi:hypothetical protein